MDNRKQNKRMLVLFCSFIGVFFLLFFIAPKQTFSPLEKRVLAQMPSFSLKEELNLERESKFSEEFDSYLADHFFGRNFWVGLNAYYELYTGRNGLHDVYAGKDGYILEKPVTVTDVNTRYTENRIEYIKSFAQETGIKPTVMIIPSTGYIQPDKLPALADEYKDDILMSQLYQRMGDTVQPLDITAALGEQAASRQIFYRTDHHWTSTGAYTAYEEYCKSAGLTPVAEEAFTKTSYGGFTGTTYSRSALWLNRSDTLELWQGPNPLEIWIQDTETTTDSPFFTEYLTQPDKYPIYLDGNRGLVRITNAKGNGQRLLLVKDSFGNCLAPFLAQNYSEVLIIDLRAYKKGDVAQLVKNEGIDHILIEYCLNQFVNDTNGIWLK